ncbi:MAG: GAF domain-containing protein [Vicinamibacterales bacterium]
MNWKESCAPVWVIWGLVAAFAVIQAVAWWLAGGVPRRPLVLVQVIAAWVVMLVLAVLASRRIETLSTRLSQKERAHLSAMDEMEQLQTQNAMLQIVARSVDVPLAFQALASRIIRIVPCDRAGLALLTETGQEFQTYTARVRENERRSRPRPEVTFKVESTAIGYVVRSAQPLILNDMREAAPEFLDANVLYNSGFNSALLMPLVSKGRTVGTLNVVSRKKDAFSEVHIDALRPIAEIFAVACVAQQLQMLIGKYRTIEAMSDQTLAIASDINGALQTIIGHCDLLERGYPDPALQRDLATIVLQAQRVAELLEKMRVTAHERLKEAAAGMSESGIPTSPEAYGRREAT